MYAGLSTAIQRAVSAWWIRRRRWLTHTLDCGVRDLTDPRSEVSMSLARPPWLKSVCALRSAHFVRTEVRGTGFEPQSLRPLCSLAQIRVHHAVLTSFAQKCVGPDLNRRTSTGQRPQRCAVGLAWLPTRSSVTHSLVIRGNLNEFPFPGMNGPTTTVSGRSHTDLRRGDGTVFTTGLGARI